MHFTLRSFALTSLTTFALTGTAFAQTTLEPGQCRSDADCESGAACEKGVAVDGCPGADPADGDGAGAPEECTSEPVVDEIGYCITQPTECESDADCGEYLRCVASDSGVCWADSEGNGGCSEPDPDAPKYCTVAVQSCTADSECPRDFECVADAAVCPAIACEKEDDPACRCEPPDTKSCQPKAIPCEASDVCPSDWSCVGNEVTVCSGGSVEPSEPGTGSEPVPPEKSECTTEPATGACYPNSWSAGDGLVYASGTPETGGSPVSDLGTDGRTDEDDDAVAAAAGCSVSAGPSTAGGFVWLLGALSALTFARRSRRAATRG